MKLLKLPKPTDEERRDMMERVPFVAGVLIGTMLLAAAAIGRVALGSIELLASASIVHLILPTILGVAIGGSGIALVVAVALLVFIWRRAAGDRRSQRLFASAGLAVVSLAAAVAAILASGGSGLPDPKGDDPAMETLYVNVLVGICLAGAVGAFAFVGSELAAIYRAQTQSADGSPPSAAMRANRSLIGFWYGVGQLVGMLFTVAVCGFFFFTWPREKPREEPKREVRQERPKGYLRMHGARTVRLSPGQIVRVTEQGMCRSLLQFTEIRPDLVAYRWRSEPEFPVRKDNETRGAGTFIGPFRHFLGVVGAGMLELTWSTDAHETVFLYYQPKWNNLEILEGADFETYDLAGSPSFTTNVPLAGDSQVTGEK